MKRTRSGELLTAIQSQQRQTIADCYEQSPQPGWTYAGGDSVAASNGTVVDGALILTNGSNQIGDPMLVVQDRGITLALGRNARERPRRRGGLIGGVRGEIIIDIIDPPPDPNTPPPSQGSSFTRGEWDIPVGGGGGGTTGYGGTPELSNGDPPDPNAPPTDGTWADLVPNPQNIRQISSEFVINGGTRARSVLLQDPAGGAIFASPIGYWMGDRPADEFGLHPGQQLVELFREFYDNQPFVGFPTTVTTQFVRRGDDVFTIATNPLTGNAAFYILDPETFEFTIIPSSPFTEDEGTYFIGGNDQVLLTVQGSNFEGFSTFQIHRSTDAAVTFNLVELAFNIEGQTLAIAAGNNATWAISVGSFGFAQSILISNDNGATWQNQPPPLPPFSEPLNLIAWTGDDLLALASSGVLWRRAGATWASSVLPAGSGSDFISISTGGTEALIVRRDFTGLRSTDGGVNWSVVSLA